MSHHCVVLTINPGSTSTKISLFRDEEEIFSRNLKHSSDELSRYGKIADQFEFRKELIIRALHEEKIPITSIHAIVGRGGLLKPIAGGTYEINSEMLEDLREAKRGEHASNLGGLIANAIAKDAGCPAYIVDPVVVDELSDVARISGHPELPRVSIFHALNQKAVARRAAKALGRKYEDMTLIVAHLGGGISVGIHQKGRVTDVNNALDGDGPFSPERTGGVPAAPLVTLCFSGRYTEKEIRSKITGKGGFVAYLGTNNAKEVEDRCKSGDSKAKVIYEAMAYQIAKEIGQLATVGKGKIDAIAITGGIAYDKTFVGLIEERVSFIAPVHVFPGEGEMESLRDGALRILHGEEKAKPYSR